MADATNISWCDASFNGWWGCEKVSPACAHCYAERDSNRYGERDLWGAGHRIRFLSDANWAKPSLWASRARSGLLPDGKPNPDGHRPRIFTASMADVFEERADLDPLRARLFRLIADTPELDWLVLTKRPPSMRDLVTRSEVYESIWDPDDCWSFRSNIWMGVSVENSAYTWRADALRDIPARVRFLSCEPLLGTLYPQDAHPLGRSAPAGVTAADDASEGGTLRRPRAALDLTGIDWVIVGGESGPRAKARPTHPDWIREIHAAVGLAPHRPAFHVKQWGSWTPDPHGHDPDAVWVKRDGSVYTPIQADASGVDLSGAHRMRYAGARPGAGGKIVDGSDFCAFPPSATELVPA